MDNALAQPRVLTHRDFMPRNLMPVPDGPAVLDFQDCVIGPIAYDPISLFKDTSLVFIMGLYDLLGIARLIVTGQDWLGHDVESYIVAGFGFWIFCFAMSRYSQRLERRLQTGHKH